MTLSADIVEYETGNRGSILNSGESSGTTVEDSVMELEEQPQAYL